MVLSVTEDDLVRVNMGEPNFEPSQVPFRANIGFMQVVERDRIRLRVYERGAGETQACGSGACAAVAVGIQQGLLAEEVRVELPGGRLDIAWKGPGQPLFMTGPAAHVYDGFIHL